MKWLGMLDGLPESHAGVPVIDRKLRFHSQIITDRAGYLFVKVPPGRQVGAGECVAEVVSVFMEVVHQVFAPTIGYCWSFTGNMAGTHAVNEGDAVAYFLTEVG